MRPDADELATIPAGMERQTPAVLILIPARLASTRLPRKLLMADPFGKTVIEHVCERAQAFGEYVSVAMRAELKVRILADRRDADEIDAVVNADRPRVRTPVVRSIGEHDCGTSRIAEYVNLHVRGSDASERNLRSPLIVHLQADEPTIGPMELKAVVEAYCRQPRCDVATLATPCSLARQGDPSTVKVSIGPGGFADRFTRKPCKGAAHHIGVYAYRPEFLTWYGTLRPGGGESDENLEQNRAMREFARYRVARLPGWACGIDTQADFDFWCEGVRRARAAAEAESIHT